MAVKLLLFLTALRLFGQTQIDYPSQVQRKPALDSREFNFSWTNGQFVTGDLSAAGAKTVTFSPNPPKGVNGADTDHYIYISGGTGTAEAVKITGGTCPAATSCTITFTTVNTHTGAWALSSATAGMSEAIWSMTSAVGGKVLLPTGNLSIHAPIKRRLLTPIWIEGEGIQATTVSVAADFPTSGINGVFDWSPGDTPAVLVGGASNLTIKFIQPDSTNVGTYTHWKPAIYTTGTYHTEWHDISIIAAWDVISMPTNTNGARFENIYSSYFHYFFSLDNSFDTVIINNAHATTTGLTVNQGTAFLASGTGNLGFSVGRVDDLKISNSTIGSFLCANFHSGSGGLGPSGFASNLWCEGNVTVTNGLLHFSGFHSAGTGSTPLFSMTGGQVFIDNSSMLFTGSVTAIALLPAAGSSSAAGSYPPQFSMTNSRLDTQGADVAMVYCSASGYTDAFDCLIEDNLFFRNSGIAYAQAAIQVFPGTGDSRLTAVGNRFSSIGGGSGVAFQINADTKHVVTGNDGGGFSYSLPATIANLQWFGNNNFLSNIHRTHDPILVSGAAGSNQVNIGLDYANALNLGVAGKTMWALGQSASKGIFRLSDGSGAGGFDSNGAQIYGTASDGQLQALKMRARQNGLDSILGPASMIGLQIVATGGAGNNLNAGTDYINALNSTGKVMWQLSQASANKGVLSISDGTGGGGWDSLGAGIYGTGVDGTLSANTLATRQLNILDLGGGSPFWFMQTSTTGLSHNLNLVDDAGVAALTLQRTILGSPTQLATLNMSLSAQSQVLGTAALEGVDAAGTTTGNGIQLKTNGGTVYFKVIGGTDAGAPGTMVSRDAVPFTDATYNLGNNTHKWLQEWLGTLTVSTALNTTSAIITAPSGSVGLSGTITVRNPAGTGTCTLTLSGGLITGTTC